MAKTVKKHLSYLDRLNFDPELLKGWVAGYLGNFRIVILALLTIVLIGVVSYLELPKRLNPEIEIPIISVVTVLPGASPEDVEALVTVPIEQKLQNAKGLDEMVSVSNNSVSVVTLTFVSDVSRDKAKDDTQSLIDTVTDLPEEAEASSVIALDFEDQPIWTFAVSSSGDTATLMNFAQQLTKQLEEMSVVDRVERTGFEETEIVVELDPETVNRYGLSPFGLSQAIGSATSSFPAGQLTTTQNAFSLSLNPSVDSVSTLRNLRISAKGESLALGDIATVKEQSKPDQSTTWVADAEQPAKRAVTFYVYKTSATSIDTAGHAVKELVEAKIAERGEQFQITTIANASEQIEEQFADLVGEFRTTIILVCGCLLLFLGLRQALISSLTVPLTFLASFVFMRFLGMSINFLSLFAFLLALGLLVDDTIVVVSTMTSYFKSKKFTPLQTGLLVWKDTIAPIWATTLTTIWSFVPLLLSTGIIGEFIKPIPIVVTVTMISSTAIAVLITLPIMMVILKPQLAQRVVFFLKTIAVLALLGTVVGLGWGNQFLPVIMVLFAVLLTVVYFVGAQIVEQSTQIWKKIPYTQQIGRGLARITNHGLIDIEVFAQKYYRLIMRVLSSRSARWQVVGAIVIYSIVSFSLLPLGLVKNEFFPKEDAETLYLNVELPAGTNLEQTEQAGVELLNQIRQTEGVVYTVAEIAQQFSDNGGRSGEQGTFLLSLRLLPKDERSFSSIDLAQKLRDQFKEYPKGTVSVVELSGGPPAGADVQVTLLGDDLNQLEKISNQVADFLKQQPGLTNIDTSIKSGTSQLVFQPNQTTMAPAGIGGDQVGVWLRTFASGWQLDTITLADDTEPTDIMLRIAGEKNPARVGNLQLRGQDGVSYPLAALGQITTQANPTQIVREDGKRRVTISATTLAGFSTSDQNKAVLEHVESIELPDGYSWKSGGVNEENQKSVNSILQAMVLSVVLILVTLVIQFRSFRQAAIVLIVIPLAVSSVFLIFALTGTPLSFPALIGVLSLFGIVVTNSMFIVDKINLNQREGMKLKEAIADAGATRLEPIILTKLCTVLGLLPVTLADPLWRGLGGAIISGILLSSTIMLLFIPVVYYNIYRSEEDN